MKAVVLEAPGPVEALQLRELPDPVPQPGWVLIEVRAAGLNRSELHTRLGMAEGMIFPRVLGLEATGVVLDCPGGEFEVGTQVMAMMGGMGRQFDGGYAELTCVPPGQTLLIRGATSSVGMAATVLAKREGLTVIGTTRNPASAGRLRELGVNHVLIDDGLLAATVREIVPAGVDAALDLVGTPTLMDCLAATRVHGVVCMSGMLSNQWTLPDFYPTGDIPSGVRLTGYTGDATNLPPEVLQRFLDDVAAGTVTVPIGKVLDLEEIQEAHRIMEAGTAGGKIVVVTSSGRTS
jgi:NADPH2:quinone reductase